MLCKTFLLTILVNNMFSISFSQGPKVIEMIKKCKYPLEQHSNVQTEDGYLLELHRISGRNVSTSKTKIPVLLMHGLLGSSADWIVTGPGRALAYVLADLGYDVWMGNARGTTWSRKHIKYDPDNEWKFWDFSWHEIGVYDLPAMIDYILSIAKQESLHYVGVSQGGTTFLVMASERPEYNKKIRFSGNLAPAVFTSNASNVVFQAFKSTNGSLEIMTKLLRIGEFFSYSSPFTKIATSICNSFEQSFCSILVQLMVGPDFNQFNNSLTSELLKNSPPGSSTKQILHFMQLLKSDRFCQYDFGPGKNLEKYNQILPPKYNLSKVAAPVGLFYSLNDWLVPAVGVHRLRSKLRNVVHFYQVPYAKFNHIDFMWATDVMPLLYDDLIEQMRKY